MIDYEVVEKVTTRIGHVVAAPVNATEFSKVMAQVRALFWLRKGRSVGYDDDLWITSDGETITIYFEVVE